MSACGHQPGRGCCGQDLVDFDGLCQTWRGVYPDFVRKKGRYGKGKALALLAALGLGAGLLSAAVALPALTPAGIATKDAATTFDHLPVTGLGLLPARSELVDAHGHLIAYYYPHGIYRVPVTYQQIAPVMRNAIIAIEDSRFYHHGAIDIRGTFRALAITLAGSVTQGGSDIAQQYVKNACILTATNSAQIAACTAETVVRKLRELRVAANVIHQMTRNQLLAGLVQNPAAYDPLASPTAALDRRNVVLARMAQLGYITQAVAERAANQP